eukprot:1181202-Prorocentrum_minimum.AAC.2
MTTDRVQPPAVAPALKPPPVTEYGIGSCLDTTRLHQTTSACLLFLFSAQAQLGRGRAAVGSKTESQKRTASVGRGRAPTRQPEIAEVVRGGGEEGGAGNPTVRSALTSNP